MRFVSASYWDLEGEFTTRADDARTFVATLVELDGARLPRARTSARTASFEAA